MEKDRRDGRQTEGPGLQSHLKKFQTGTVNERIFGRYENSGKVPEFWRSLEGLRREDEKEGRRRVGAGNTRDLGLKRLSSSGVLGDRSDKLIPNRGDERVSKTKSLRPDPGFLNV